MKTNNELINIFESNPMLYYEFLDAHNSFSIWFKIKYKILYFLKKTSLSSHGGRS